MKKLQLLALFLLTSISVSAQQAQANNNFGADVPVFKFESELIDYGKIDQNSDGNRIFKFTNVGKSPLIITSVTGSCGCTVPTKPEDPIMPGETGEIKVKYDTKRSGRFSKSVTITSNASEAKKIVRIKGEVIAPKAS